MNSDREQFLELRRFNKPVMVGGIKGGIPAVGVGKVRITDRNGRARTLENVLYMPKLKNNLLSLTKLTLAGWRSVFENGSCTVTHGDFVIQTPIENGLCLFESAPHVFAAAASLTKHGAKAMIKDWHERLGHVSKGAILKLSDKVEGLDIDPMDSEEPEC